MPDLPEYLTDQTEEEIRQRMLDSLPPDLDKSEGSYIWDSIDPVAIELTQAADWAQEVRRRGFASTAASTIPGTKTTELDLRCEEHGVFRKAAVKSTGTTTKGNPLTIYGTIGTVIAAGFEVATPADAFTGTPSVEFVTTAECTIGAGGNVAVDIEAVNAGVSGNVPAGAISVIVTPVPGVTGIVNSAPINGGLDEEDDVSLLARYLQKKQNPSAGGNRADYINWAGEVAGVGGVSVVPVKYGNGTVGIAIIDTNKQPASQELVDVGLEYIAAPWVHDVEAEIMTVGGSGTSIDATQEDDRGSSVKMEYNAAGEGTIVHANIHTLLDKPGIWQVRPKVKSSAVDGVDNLLQVGVWNITTGTWAKVSSAGGAADAVTIYQGNDLSLAFSFLAQPFYWNGTDSLELRINRMQADITTVLWMDLVKYRSTFSKDTGDGKAPIGAAVYVEAAPDVPINISATLTPMSGYDLVTAKANAEAAFDNYLKEIAFAGVNTPGKETDNDVKYGHVYGAILAAAGVDNCENLLINGAAVGVAIGAQEVAVKGTVAFS